MSLCPECGATIDLDADELEEGEVVSCPECSAELEVVNTHPLELDVVDDDEEELEEADEEDSGEDDDEDDFEDEEDNGLH